MLTEEIIGKIKKVREEKGISRYRLAQLTGLHRSSIKRYEEGYIKKYHLSIYQRFVKL